MVGLDTNVLVRYLAQDDARQAALATELIESLTPQAPGFIGSITLVQSLWVMEDVYGTSRERMADIVEGLLHTDSLVVQAAEATWRALAGFRKGKADFADHLIARIAAAEGCDGSFTFDRAAARDGVMTMLGAGARPARG